MSKIKTAVRILTGDAAITQALVIKDPNYGPMLPGPAYDAYADLRHYQTALVALVHGLEGFDITKADALERITALQAHPQTATGSIREYLRDLRAALDPKDRPAALDLSAPAKVAQALARVREYLQPLSMGVGSLAHRVPKPVDPNAPRPAEGQRLGTGLRDAWA